MTIVRTIAAVHRGPRLFAWRVARDDDRPKRTILFVHGAGEHSQRYLSAARRLARDNWEVIGFDLRGHGCSDGLPVHVRAFRDYVEDVGRVAEHFRLDPETTGVVAHSLGGLVSIATWQQEVFRPAAIAMSAPLLRLAAEVPLWKLLLGRSVKRAWPTTRFATTIEPKHLLNDATALAVRESDPLICRSLTAGFFFNVTAASQKIWRREMPTPTLIFQGDADKVVDPEAATKWHERDPSRCELRTIPGAAHELFHEPDGFSIVQDAARWIDARMAETAVSRRAA